VSGQVAKRAHLVGCRLWVEHRKAATTAFLSGSLRAHGSVHASGRWRSSSSPGPVGHFAHESNGLSATLPFLSSEEKAFAATRGILGLYVSLSLTSALPFGHAHLQVIAPSFKGADAALIRGLEVGNGGPW
jgi:hypothetical protein